MVGRRKEMTLRRVGVLAFLSACLAALCLPACSKTKAVSAISKEAMGVLDSEGGVEDISGWAWDPAQPDTPIRVEVFGDEKSVGFALADGHREDLLKEGKGNGNHGFDFPFPENLRDGKPHNIRVRIAEVNIELVNSPRSLSWKNSEAVEEKPAKAPKASGPAGKKDKSEQKKPSSK